MGKKDKIEELENSLAEMHEKLLACISHDTAISNEVNELRGIVEGNESYIASLREANRLLHNQNVHYIKELANQKQYNTLVSKSNAENDAKVTVQKLRIEELSNQLKDYQERVNYALKYCPTCSTKPGMPDLCNICVALQNGEWIEPHKDEDVSNEEYLYIRVKGGRRLTKEQYNSGIYGRW